MQIISLILILCAIPLGIFAKSLTKDEKKIYCKKQYFPTIILITSISILIFYFINIIIAKTLLFITLLILFWKK